MVLVLRIMWILWPLRILWMLWVDIVDLVDIEGMWVLWTLRTLWTWQAQASQPRRALQLGCSLAACCLSVDAIYCNLLHRKCNYFAGASSVVHVGCTWLHRAKFVCCFIEFAVMSPRPAHWHPCSWQNLQLLRIMPWNASPCLTRWSPPQVA